jgi:hypothetical protein
MRKAIRATPGQGSCLDFDLAWFYIRPDWLGSMRVGALVTSDAPSIP